MINDSKNYP